MAKENIVDLIHYQNQSNATNTASNKSSTISDELQHAIQNLIIRLRELGPLQHSN